MCDGGKSKFVFSLKSVCSKTVQNTQSARQVKTQPKNGESLNPPLLPSQRIGWVSSFRALHREYARLPKGSLASAHHSLFGGGELALQ